jgi:hypothetical protein
MSLCGGMLSSMRLLSGGEMGVAGNVSMMGVIV